MEAMESAINTDPRVKDYRFPDQDFLADFFFGKWKPLPWFYNALKKLRGTHCQMWRDDEVRNVHVSLFLLINLDFCFRSGRRTIRKSARSHTEDRSFQYIINKPWNFTLHSDDPDYVTHSWWWDAYRAHEWGPTITKHVSEEPLQG